MHRTLYDIVDNIDLTVIELCCPKEWQRRSGGVAVVGIDYSVAKRLIGRLVIVESFVVEIWDV